MDNDRGETAAQKKKRRRPGVGRPVEDETQRKTAKPAAKLTQQAKGKGPANRAVVSESDSSDDPSGDIDGNYEEDWVSDDESGAGQSTRGAPSSPDPGPNRPKRQRMAPRKLFTPNAQ